MADDPPGGPALTRRRLLATGGAAGLLAGCAAPFPAPEAESAYPPIGEFVDVDGALVHLWRRVPDDPAAAARLPAVLMHGASGNLRDFTFSIAPRIAATRPVIAVDRPGFGYTDRPAEGFRPEVQARLIRRAVARLGHDRTLVLGHSYGAAVGMAWALDAPETVAGYVPVSGVTMPYHGLGRVFSALGLAGVVTWAYTEYLKSTIDDGGVRDFLERAFRPQPIPEGYVDYVGAPLALRRKTLEANAEDLEHVNAELFDMRPRYPDMTIPTEVIHGAADFIDAEDQGEALAPVLPDARLTVLPGVGHMAHHAATDVLIAALDRLDPATSGAARRGDRA